MSSLKHFRSGNVTTPSCSDQLYVMEVYYPRLGNAVLSKLQFCKYVSLH